MSRRIAVLGGGNIALAASVELVLEGHRVNLFELPQFKANIEPIIRRRLVESTGLLERVAELDVVTTNVEEATENADIILIVVPAYGVKSFSRACIPHLEDGQTVIFMGKGGHTLTFEKILRELGEEKKDIVLGETHSAPYTTRRKDPLKIEIMWRIDLLAASLPAKDTHKLVATLRELFPNHYFAPVQNVLTTTLCDLNAHKHPSRIFFNVTKVGPKGEFFLNREFISDLRQGVLPNGSVFADTIMEAAERERLTIMQALGLEPIRMNEISRLARTEPLSNEEKRTREDGRIAWSEYINEKGLERRYLSEDVPYGLVTMASLGHMVGVETPTIDVEINLASILLQTNYWRIGRTVEELGISRLSVDELHKFLNEGTRPQQD